MEHQHTETHDHGGSGGASPLSSHAVFDRRIAGSSASDVIVAPMLYRAEVQSLNNSGVSGTVDLALVGNQLSAHIVIAGLEPNQLHIQHIHGVVGPAGNGDSATPSLAADTDGDGFIEVLEGVPFYGAILVNLVDGAGNFPATTDGTLHFGQTYDLANPATFNAGFDAGDVLPLDLREFVIHGLTVDGSAGAGTPNEVDGTPGYKVALPVGAGEFEVVGVRIDGGAGNDRITGSRADDRLIGGTGSDTIHGLAGDDLIRGGTGNDRLMGGEGSDFMRGGAGNDVLKGGTGSDILLGGAGNDFLYGSANQDRTDLAGNTLNGGAGNDLLCLRDGVNTATGGSGSDRFRFSFNDPMTALAAGTGPGFTAITDFSAARDTLAFDVAGIGHDAVGANFIDATGGVGGAAPSFFQGAAADASGEAVMVITDQAFASGALVAPSIDGEQAGDFIVYFNTTVGVASLLTVRGVDMAASIARFTDIQSLEELANTGFTADDFLFV